MIETIWPYLAIMLLAAGLFPSLEKRYRWRFFSILPPIVLTYLFVTALAVVGVWSPTGEVQSAQRVLTAHLLPALLFLLMVTCDLRAILKVGPRVLAVFACAMGSILVAIIVVYALFRSVLPQDGWKMLAALSATWTGGSANLVAVKQTIGLPENLLPPVLLADALCYSLWVLALLSSGSFVTRFNRWTRADARPYPELAAPTTEPADSGGILLWLGLALVVGLGAARLAASMPVSTMLTTTSWTVLIATLAGLIVCSHAARKNSRAGAARQCPARNARGGARVAEQLRRHGVRAAVHSVRSARARDSHRAARARGAHCFALTFSCAASRRWRRSAASPRRRCSPPRTRRYLVPIAVLLAMLGLILGTGVGLLMANVLLAMAPA